MVHKHTTNFKKILQNSLDVPFIHDSIRCAGLLNINNAAFIYVDENTMTFKRATVFSFIVAFKNDKSYVLFLYYIVVIITISFPYFPLNDYAYDALNKIFNFKDIIRGKIIVFLSAPHLIKII